MDQPLSTSVPLEAQRHVSFSGDVHLHYFPRFEESLHEHKSCEKKLILAGASPWAYLHMHIKSGCVIIIFSLLQGRSPCKQGLVERSTHILLLLPPHLIFFQHLQLRRQRSPSSMTSAAAARACARNSSILPLIKLPKLQFS